MSRMILRLVQVLTFKATGCPCPGVASRRASFARPGRACLVQVERPAGRTTWTRQARSGGLRCAMGHRDPAIPERPRVQGRSPGRRRPSRVVGPEALPAGGMSAHPAAKRRAEHHAPCCARKSGCFSGEIAGSARSELVRDNPRVDNTVKLPVWLYVVAVVFFPAFGLVFLISEGHWSAAFLNLVGIAYAIGLGRALLWRRLGRPALPTRRGANSTAARPPS